MIEIEKRGYLGIDESNHGKFPEIYVSVFSINENDIEICPLDKQHKKNLKVEEILNSRGIHREFFHSVIPTIEFKHIFGEYGLKVISLAEHIKSNYERTDLGSFDGELRDIDRINLERIIYPLKLPKLICEPRADIKYPLVNMADSIANILSRYYLNLKKSESGNRYNNTKLKFPLGEYIKFRYLFE